MIAHAYYDESSQGIVYWVSSETNEALRYSDYDSDSGESTGSGDTLLSCEISGLRVCWLCLVV